MSLRYSSFNTEVITSNVLEGFHYWPNAPEAVSFLRDNHRHLFHIRCAFGVSDLDREVEIILMQREVEKFLCGKYGCPCQFESMSCEMIGAEILTTMNAVWVEVLEDGQGGAIVRK